MAVVLLPRRARARPVVAIQFYLFQRNQPEDVGLAPIDDPETEVDESRATPDPSPAASWASRAPRGPTSSSSAASTSSRSSSATRCGRGRRTSSSGTTTCRTARPPATRSCSTSCGVPGVYITGWLSDRYFGSRRAGISLVMMLGMTVATGLLVAFGDSGVGVVRRCCSASSASRSTAPTRCSPAPARSTSAAAAPPRSSTAVISGFGSLGPVVQELVIARVYDPKGDLGPIFVLLFGSAIAAALFCAALVWRNRRGGKGSDVYDDAPWREPSILIVHPDRKTQRTVQRILGVDRLSRRHRRRPRAGHPPARSTSRRCSSSSTAALSSPSGTAELLRRREGARRRGLHDAARRARRLDQMPAILGLGAVTNLLVHPMPVLAEELTITAQKLIRGDLFGAEKYLLWGTDLERDDGRPRQPARRASSAQLAEQVRARGQSARVASMAMLVTDELISNAVHNAPIDAAGVHYRRDLPRDAELELDERHQVRLRWGCDARYLAIEVTDRFGSLDRDTILRALAQNDVRESGGGAGMGIALTYRFVRSPGVQPGPGEAHRDHRPDRCPLPAERANGRRIVVQRVRGETPSPMTPPPSETRGRMTITVVPGDTGDLLALAGAIDETAALHELPSRARGRPPRPRPRRRHLHQLARRARLDPHAGRRPEGRARRRAAAGRRAARPPAQHDHRHARHAPRSRRSSRPTRATRCGREESLLIDAVAHCRERLVRLEPPPMTVSRVRRADGVQRLPRALLLVPLGVRSPVLEDFAHAVQGLVRDLGYPGLFFLIVLESTMVPIPSLLVMPFAGLPRLAAATSRSPRSSRSTAAPRSPARWSRTGSGAAGGKPLLLRYGKYVLVRPKDIEKTEHVLRQTRQVRPSSSAASCRSCATSSPFRPASRGCRSPPFLTLTFLGATIWGGGLMILGYELGSRWESVATKAKRVDLVIAVGVVLVILAIAIRFVLRRRRERTAAASAAAGTEPQQNNPETAID